MHWFSALLRMAHSTVVSAALPLALLGCGNAPAGGQTSADSTSLRPVWTPRGIQAPRPVVDLDSTPDSLASDSLVADSALSDTSKAGTPVRRASQPKKKDPFPLTPGDSARWPVPGAPEPLPGAIIPEHRIVAFYGNPLSKRMGILGQIDPDSMLQKLEADRHGMGQGRPGPEGLTGPPPDRRGCSGIPGAGAEVPAADARQHRRAGGGLGRAARLAPVSRYPARV